MAIAHDDLIIRHALTPKWQRVMSVAIDNVKHGAPREDYELEDHEVLPFIAEEYEGETALSMLIDAVYDKDEKRKARMVTLIGECVGDISADHLGELRELIRSALIDYTSKLVRLKLEEA